jgi:hypothetical protein
MEWARKTLDNGLKWAKSGAAKARDDHRGRIGPEFEPSHDLPPIIASQGAIVLAEGFGNPHKAGFIEQLEKDEIIDPVRRTGGDKGLYVIRYKDPERHKKMQAEVERVTARRQRRRRSIGNS